MVQTYTHALGGAVIAQTALTFGMLSVPDSMSAWVWYSVVWIIATAGAVAPDVVMIPAFAIAKWQGKRPFVKQSALLMVLKELSHSLILWPIATLMLWLVFPSGPLSQLALLFGVAGLMGGVLPDIPTHSEAQYKDTDCTFLYPLGGLFQRSFGFSSLRWPNDRWEYRFGHGVITRLKPWERNLNIGMVVVITILMASMLG